MIVFCDEDKGLIILEEGILEEKIASEIIGPPRIYEVLSYYSLDLLNLAEHSGYVYYNCYNLSCK